jgi:hypothetical protein
MTGDERSTDAGTSARNRGLAEEEKRLRDPEQRPPRRAVEQDAPEPERATTPQEDEEQAIAQLENPPQAEGPRERNNDAV